MKVVFSFMRSKSEFRHTILPLMSGSAVSQAIPVVISPILTRMYSPAEFGFFAIYLSCFSILSAIITARMQMAIVLQKDAKGANSVAGLVILISVFISAFFLILLSFYSREIGDLFNITKYISWFYWMPFALFLFAVAQVFYYLNNRSRFYKVMAYSKIAQSSSMCLIQISTLIVGAGGFVFGHFFGLLSSTVFLLRASSKTLRPKLRDPFFHLVRNKNFPLYDIPSSIISLSSHQLPTLLFSTIFSASSVGMYTLAQRTLFAPVSVISDAFLDVFREQASGQYHESGEMLEVFVLMAKKLLILAMPPSLVIYFFAPYLFGVVFGDDWVAAGELASTLAPVMFLRFVVSPLTVVFYITGKQFLNLLGMILMGLSIFLSFYVYSPSSIAQVVSNLSFGMSLVYSIYFGVSYHLAKGSK